MTNPGFLSLPTELVLQIVSYSKSSSLLSLLLCNRALCDILMPLLHTRALGPFRKHSAIQWAANRDQIGLVKFVLATGMHPDTGATLTKGPALRSAVRNGSLEVAELLLSHGADINRETNDGKTEPVIHLAAANGDNAMIKLLAAHGADLAFQNLTRSSRGTALHVAASWGEVSAVRTLLDLHVRVDALNNKNETPLDVVTRIACYDTRTAEELVTFVEIGMMLVDAGAMLWYIQAGLGMFHHHWPRVQWQMDLIAPEDDSDDSD